MDKTTLDKLEKKVKLLLFRTGMNVPSKRLEGVKTGYQIVLDIIKEEKEAVWSQHYKME